jgi:hypothetical protein
MLLDRKHLSLYLEIIKFNFTYCITLAIQSCQYWPLLIKKIGNFTNLYLIFPLFLLIVHAIVLKLSLHLLCRLRGRCYFSKPPTPGSSSMVLFHPLCLPLFSPNDSMATPASLTSHTLLAPPWLTDCFVLFWTWDINGSSVFCPSHHRHIFYYYCIINLSWAWWHLPIIPTLRRLRQEDDNF